MRSPEGRITTFDAPGADTTAGSFNGTLPNAINDEGVITGVSYDANGAGHGFLRASAGAFKRWRLFSSAPPLPGGEYLNADVLAALWEQIDVSCRTERVVAKQTLQEFLKGRNPAWHLVGRVHFNLAENRSDEEAPFAFIATYTTRLSAQSRAQHLPIASSRKRDIKSVPK